ncbi:MAG: hypothetical protein HYV95_06860 [Opitutae bacterium]|nr:hypothetical protein [Opitutae bacterium]
MLRSLVGDQFAKEVHLDRPPRTIGERVFRFSVYFFIVSSILGGLAEFAGVDKKIGESMGFLMWPFSVLFMFSFIYMLAFAYVRYVRPQKVRRSSDSSVSGEPIQSATDQRP